MIRCVFWFQLCRNNCKRFNWICGKKTFSGPTGKEFILLDVHIVSTTINSPLYKIWRFNLNKKLSPSHTPLGPVRTCSLCGLYMSTSKLLAFNWKTFLLKQWRGLQPTNNDDNRQIITPHGRFVKRAKTHWISFTITTQFFKYNHFTHANSVISLPTAKTITILNSFCRRKWPWTDIGRSNQKTEMSETPGYVTNPRSSSLWQFHACAITRWVHPHQSTSRRSFRPIKEGPGCGNQMYTYQQRRRNWEVKIPTRWSCTHQKQRREQPEEEETSKT